MTKTSATTTSQYRNASRSPEARKPMATAPRTGPARLVRPPTAVQMTSSADSRNPTAWGVTMPWWGAYSAPARPATPALVANARALRRLVLKPKNWSRSSFWATAASNCPNGALSR